jgi:hypothetical protein
MGAALLGGGWIREKRKARKDAGAFALSLIETQASRIDGLIKELGVVEGRVEELSRRKLELEADKAHLLAENAELRARLEILERRAAKE